MLAQTGGGSSASQRAAAARERLKLQLQQRCSNPACGTHAPPSASASASTETSEEPKQPSAAPAAAAVAAPSGPIVLSECSRCHQARYCSKACQVAHWDAHKVPCKEARRVIEEAAALALAAPARAAAAAAVAASQ